WPGISPARLETPCVPYVARSNSSDVNVMVLLASIFGMSVSAVSSLRVLAGRNRPCGSRAARTLPVSRSATIHAGELTIAGIAGAPGNACTRRPDPPSSAPPIGALAWRAVEPAAGSCVGAGDGETSAPNVGEAERARAIAVSPAAGQRRSCMVD